MIMTIIIIMSLVDRERERERERNGMSWACLRRLIPMTSSAAALWQPQGEAPEATATEATVVVVSEPARRKPGK